MGTAESAIRFDLFARDQTKAGIKSADSSFGKFGKGLVTKFAAAGAAIGAVSLFKGFLDEAQESVRVGKLTENVIRSTGGAAKVTASQVGDLATKLSNKTAIDDEVIQSGENLLLTFTKVRNETGKNNDIFDRASKAALDMAAGLNGGNVTAENLKGSSIQLGKALNDPVKGITALSKSGVSFTEGQKKQIKEMVKTGDTLGAQKVILTELNKEFGGAAAAAASPAQKATVAWGNLKEQIGMGILPLFNKVATFASNKLIPAISTGITKLGPTFKSIGKAISVFKVALSGESSSGEFEGGLNKINRVGLKVGEWIRNDFLPAAKQLGTWFKTEAVPAIQRFGAALWKNLQPAIAAMVTAFQTQMKPALQTVIAKFQEAWPTIQRVLAILGQVAAFILTKVVPVLIQFYSKYLATWIKVLANVFAAVWKLIGVLIDFDNKVISVYKSIGAFVSSVVTAMSGFVSAVKDGIGKAITAVAGLPGKAIDAVGNMASTLYNVGIDLIQGFINGIIDKAKDIVGTIKSSITDVIPDFIKKPLGIASPSKVTMKYGQWVSEGFAIGIGKGAGKVKDQVAAMVDSIKAKIDEAKDFGKNLRDSFKSFGDITSIDTMSEDGQDGGLTALLAGMKKRLADASAFAATIKKLRKAGLNETSLSNLRDAGPEGGLKAAQQLLSGGSSTIGQFNQLTKQLGQTGQVFANRETRAMYGFSGDPNTATLKGGGQNITLRLDGSGDDLTEAIVKALRQKVRKSGGNVQVVLGAR